MSQQQYQRELNRKQLPTLWMIPEKMWQEIRPLLPPEKEPATPGRTPVPFRKVMNGILFVLRTGCQWKALPKNSYGSGSTVHRRFQQELFANVVDRAPITQRPSPRFSQPTLRLRTWPQLLPVGPAGSHLAYATSPRLLPTA
jgi:transposase